MTSETLTPKTRQSLYILTAVTVLTIGLLETVAIAYGVDGKYLALALLIIGVTLGWAYGKNTQLPGVNHHPPSREDDDGAA